MIPFVMAAGAAIQAGGAIAKSISGAQRAKKMQDAIASYQRQELTNSYRGKVAVSTLGADLRREEQGRLAATSMDALTSGGVRGMVGGVGRVQAGSNQVNREIAANLDQQQQSIDMAAAQDDSRIRAMQEQREQADLAGMGRELQSGRQDMWGGIGDLGQTLMSGAMMADHMGMGAETGVAKPKVSAASTLTAGAFQIAPQIRHQSELFNPFGLPSSAANIYADRNQYNPAA